MGRSDLEDSSHLPKSMIEKTGKEKRARWNSTLAFILAAVGSAVGLGNVWRFPYLVSKHGGAPFLIPYLVCLILVGMPILLMELSLGQMFQGGDIEAFGRMNPRMRGIGLASVFGSFVIVSYYAVILAYAGIYFVYSFKSPLAYAVGVTTQDVTLDAATRFFYEDVIKLGDMNKPTYAMSGEMVLALAVIWVLVFCCIFNGVDTASWVVYITVPVPIILIIILLIKGATLEGSGDGIKEYIGKWDGNALNSVSMWSDAVGQVFFTLSVCMGVMTAYSSHNTIKHQVGRDEKIISLSDMGIALLGGFTVYCMLGHLEHLTNDKGIYQISSMSLAFVAYPTGISLVGGSNFWGILFFLCLILLGIDSAFSMVEAVTTVITDSWIAKRYKLGKPICSFVVCLVAFALGTMYTMDIGLFLLDAIDHYVNNWGMIFLGFLEAVSVGWVYKSKAQQKKVGKKSVVTYNFFFFFALLIGIIVGLSAHSEKYVKQSKWDGSGTNLDTRGHAAGMKLEDLNNADSMKFVLSASGTDPAFKITFEENKEITSVHVAPRYIGELKDDNAYKSLECMKFEDCSDQFNGAAVFGIKTDDGQVSFGTVSANAQASSYEVRNEAQKDVKFKGILIQMAGVDKVLGVGSVMVEQPHTSGATAGGWGVFAGLIIYAIGLIIALVLADSSVPFKSRVWGIVGWYGPDRLRKMINSTDGPNWEPGTLKSELQAFYKPHFVSIMFSFLIKYFIPTILWVLFFTTFKADVTTKYGGYLSSYQVVGYLMFTFMALLVLTVAVFPRVLIDPEASGKDSILQQITWIFTPQPAKTDITAVNDESEVYENECADTVYSNPS